MGSSRARSRHRREKVLKRLLNLFIAFVVGLALSGCVFVLELHYGWQSSRLLYQTVVGSGYAYRNVQQYKESLVDLLEEQALPEEIVDDIFNEESMYRQYSRDIERVLLKGEDVQRTGEEFGESFAAAIERNLTGQGMSINEELQDQIDQIGHRAALNYENLMSVSYMVRFRELAEESFPMIRLGGLIALAVMLIGACVLWKLHHYKFHALQYYSSAVLFASVCNVLSILVLGRTGWIRNVGIGPESYRGMLEEFYKKGVEFCSLITLVELAVLMALMILAKRLKRKM